jgi:hypothetical protein
MGLKGLWIRLENRQTQSRLNALKNKIIEDDRREQGLPPLGTGSLFSDRVLILIFLGVIAWIAIAAVAFSVMWWMGWRPGQ